MRTQNPNLDKEAIRRLRVARARGHVEAMVNSSDATLHLIRHPLLKLDLAGVTTHLELDVLSCTTLGRADLVRYGKIRWRIEHDYRKLKTGLGLDHFEGRSFTGWHRHVTLVTAAQLSSESSASPASVPVHHRSP